MKTPKKPWQDLVYGMKKPHLHVSPEMYMRLKHDPEFNGGAEMARTEVNVYSGGIPIHVEHALPFENAEGEMVDIFALDYFALKPFGYNAPEPLPNSL